MDTGYDCYTIDNRVHVYNGLETEVCDITKEQWAAGIPNLAIRIMHYKQNVHLNLW